MTQELLRQRQLPDGTHCHVRWGLRRDMPEILAIESQCYGRNHRWSEEDFIQVLRRRNAISMVADMGDDVVGYVAYELHATYLEVLRLSVAKEHQRRGVGTMILDKLKAKLSLQRRRRFSMFVNEQNLGAQLFLRASGLRCVAVNDGEYRFVYRHREN